MKTQMKPYALSMVVILVMFSILAACSKESGGSTEKGIEGNSNEDGFVLGEDELEYTFYGHYDWYTMPNWGEDPASKWIKENLKVNITPISSGGNAAQKFNTMIVGNDLPDVIWMERGTDVEKLREAGMLVPFDDYLDKYPNLKEWAGEGTLNMLRSEDGKLYQFPNWYSSKPAGNAGYVVNEKIYKELGEPKLETTEDLYNYLKQVKEKYPDVIPYEPGTQGSGIHILYTAFAEETPTAYISNRAVVNGDKLTSIFTDPVYRESMQYVNRLFREKLMSQDALTQTEDQRDEKLMTGRFAIYGGEPKSAKLAHTTLQAEDPDASLKMIWPFYKEGLDPKKITTGTWSSLGWNVSVITKNAKNPEAIFAYLDWMTGPEGQRTLMWGPEGILWDGTDADGLPIYTDTYKSDIKERDEIMSSTGDIQWVGNSTYVDTAKTNYELSLPEEQQEWSTRYQSGITWHTHANGTQFANLTPMPESEEGMIQQRINDIFEETWAKAVHASSDQEVLDLLDQAEKSAQSVGYDKLLEYKTKKWKENLEKMGE